MSVDRSMVVVWCSALLAIGMAGLAGAAFVGKRHLAEQNESTRIRLQQTADELESVATETNDPATESTLPRQRLLPMPDVVGTLRELNALGADAGITLDNQQALKAAGSGKQAFVVSGRGRPERVCRFLQAVENNERLLIVETGRVFAASGGDIAFEFGLATYHGGEQQ